ncbi:MAG: glycosyltransferase family 39 protein, partial [Bdellovibrionales bacterium]|nr:glycosyltransferase family 39 protein [Bdellovibrionales bacterium]
MDEAHSVYKATFAPTMLIEYLRRDCHPPFYYILLHAWIARFGDSEVALRGFSAMFYWLTALAIIALGRLLNVERAFSYGALFFVLSPLAVFHSQNVRMYSFASFLSVLSVLFLLRGWSGDSQKWLFRMAYALSIAVGSFTLYWYLFLLPAHLLLACYLFKRKDLGSFVVILGISLLPFALMWSPILFGQLGNGSSDYLQSQWKKDLVWTFPGFFGRKQFFVIYGFVFLSSI